MSLCSSCRLALRRASLQIPRHSCRRLSTKPSPAIDPREILSKPTWSVRSLLPSSTSEETGSPDPSDETITPSELHHILRLSALPLPKTKEDEDAMLATLQSQLHFVRTIQNVDTTGVEPLRAIRDETEKAVQENTVTLDKLKHLLDKEARVGHYQRPKRVKSDQAFKEAAEDWDPLSTASQRAGRFFVVHSKGKGQEEASG